jgi:hypothetical protein
MAVAKPRGYFGKVRNAYNILVGKSERREAVRQVMRE